MAKLGGFRHPLKPSGSDASDRAVPATAPSVSLAAQIASARRVLGKPKPPPKPMMANPTATTAAAAADADADAAQCQTENITGSASTSPGCAAGSGGGGGEGGHSDSGTDCVQALIGQLAVRRQAIESNCDSDEWSDSILDEWD